MNNNIKSIKDRLKNYSKKKNKIHQFTLVRYFQERLLYRLSQSDYREKFLLKGGALVYSLQKEESRNTLDIDLLAKRLKSDEGQIGEIFKNICELQFYDGVTFDTRTLVTQEIIKEGNYSGIRVKVAARLGNIKQTMQIDIGFGDIVTPGPVEMEYPTLIEVKDLGKPKLLAYSVETLLAEKFQAMIDLGEYNSRMKDFYDVYTILKTGKYDNQTLKNAVANTFAKRKTKRTENHVVFTERFYQEEKRVIQWKAFLRKSKLDKELEFSKVMKYIKLTMLPIYQELK